MFPISHVKVIPVFDRELADKVKHSINCSHFNKDDLSVRDVAPLAWIVRSER